MFENVFLISCWLHDEYLAFAIVPAGIMVVISLVLCVLIFLQIKYEIFKEVDESEKQMRLNLFPVIFTCLVLSGKPSFKL